MAIGDHGAARRGAVSGQPFSALAYSGSSTGGISTVGCGGVTVVVEQSNNQVAAINPADAEPRKGISDRRAINREFLVMRKASNLGCEAANCNRSEAYVNDLTQAKVSRNATVSTRRRHRLGNSNTRCPATCRGAAKSVSMSAAVRGFANR